MGQGPSELRLGNQRTAFWEAGNQSQGSVINSNLLISLNELTTMVHRILRYRVSYSVPGNKAWGEKLRNLPEADGQQVAASGVLGLREFHLVNITVLHYIPQTSYNFRLGRDSRHIIRFSRSMSFSSFINANSSFGGQG